MKRLLALLILCSTVTSCGILGYNGASGKYCQYLDGYWGQWESFFAMTTGAFQGDPGNFVVYKNGSHPSDFCFRISSRGFDKSAVKKNSWEKLSGTIEFYSNHPAGGQSASKSFVSSTLGFLDGKAIGNEVVVKRPATIDIQRVSGGYLYNVFFDNVGFAIVIPWDRAR